MTSKHTFNRMKNEKINTYNKGNKTLNENLEALILIYTERAIYDFDYISIPPPILPIK